MMRRSLFVLLAVSAPIVAGCSGELRELPPLDENVSLDAGTPRPDPRPDPEPEPDPMPDPDPRPDPEPDPMPDPQPGCDVAIEQDVIALANQARGEAPLRCDPEMSTVARAHSADMCERDYFDHTSLDGRSPFDRMRDAGIRFGAAGENIAWGQPTAAAVHDAWMNSSGHRRNILNGGYRRSGVGYVRCGGRPYWTQVFAD